jgi:hypothetical protein
MKYVLSALLFMEFLFGQPAMGEVIFSSNVEDGTLREIFSEDVNRYCGIECEISTDVAHSGSRSVKLGYPKNEAGVELKPPPFAPTKTLFCRKYEYFAPGWEKNWPTGLKTSRYFTTPSYRYYDEGKAYAYMSEKFIYQTYNCTCNEEFGMGMMHALYNLDLRHMYEEDETFGNGKPYIRTGHWYRFETWMVLDSAVDAEDGVLQFWVDDVLMYSNKNVPWRSTRKQNRPTNGGGWQSMWFGGNYSGANCGDPSRTVYRYIDDFYLSTTLDREDGTPPPAD